MNIIQIIEKKKNHQALSQDEIAYFIDGYVNEEIEDYQASALLMAICLNGMDEQETYYLTLSMLHSGQVLDFSKQSGIFVDKHSTGGVGDKTSLALIPMLAANGLKVAKMSGRGLGHTGGTIDKLESIPGYNVNIDEKAFIEQVNKVGCSIIAQSQQMVPADKKLYALRDVSGTIDSIPLIASSIMSKKLASGAQIILLDVKYGDGAFMANREDAQALGDAMVKIGKLADKKVLYELSDMNQPLGRAIGNNLEVKEAVDTLNGHGPQDFEKLCIDSGAKLLHEACPSISLACAEDKMRECLNNKTALLKFKAMVEAQGGDITYLDNPEKFDQAAYIIGIKAQQSGLLKHIKAKELGLLSCDIGAGRHQLGDKIDYATGIIVEVKLADEIKQGDPLCYLYMNKVADEQLIKRAQDLFIIE